VSDLKDLTILNDFKSLNAQLATQTNIMKQQEAEMDKHLVLVKSSLIKILYELQHEYYTSNYK
jgi:hypothetical protein